MEWAIALGIVVAVTILLIGVATVILKVVWHASGNLIDWIIYTFGNEDAVKDLKRRRGWN